MTEPMTPERAQEIRAGVASVKPEVSPDLAPLDDPFVIALAAKLNAIAPSPAPRSLGVELALYEARALAGAGPLLYLRQDAAKLAETKAEIDLLRAELDAVQRRYTEDTAELKRTVDKAEAELKKYVGVEPTVADESAYLTRCLNAVREVCDTAEKQATRWEQPLPVPEWVATVREAAHGERPEPLTPIPLHWDRLVMHPDGSEDDQTIVCCMTEDGRPAALFLDDEHREALGLQLIDPDGDSATADCPACGCIDRECTSCRASCAATEVQS